jgi:flagellar motor switch protein FliN
MKTYLDCWVSSAQALFSQALAGEPQLSESGNCVAKPSGPAYCVEISGDLTGRFTVMLDSELVKAPLLGEGVNQEEAWAELLREVADSASGELLATSRQSCRVESCRQADSGDGATRGFVLRSAEHSWTIQVRDELVAWSESSRANEKSAAEKTDCPAPDRSTGIELLLNVELEAALRFGCCEMPLGEILELGPGDVVELDRHITDPVDLIVGDKIVARGEVVLVNGNFGLRVTEVAAPQSRLESIRCLF